MSTSELTFANYAFGPMEIYLQVKVTSAKYCDRTDISVFVVQQRSTANLDLFEVQRHFSRFTLNQPRYYVLPTSQHPTTPSTIQNKTITTQRARKQQPYSHRKIHLQIYSSCLPPLLNSPALCMTTKREM